MRFSVNSVILSLAATAVVALLVDVIVELGASEHNQRMSDAELRAFDDTFRTAQIQQCIASINNNSLHWPDSLKEYASEATKKCVETSYFTTFTKGALH